jgi:transcriptional regulator with XRE-family HTH domain
MLSTSPIRFHRERAGMSQQELALLSGLTMKYLDELERREQPRFTVRVRALSRLLKVRIEELRP